MKNNIFLNCCSTISIISIYFNVSITSFNTRIPRLGVDYSRSNIGLAFSSLLPPRPLRTLKNSRNLTAMTFDVHRLAKLYNAREIIVGVPVDSTGVVRINAPGNTAQYCIAFARRLASVISHCQHQENEINTQVPLYIKKILIRLTPDNFIVIKIILADERYTTREAHALYMSGQTTG